MLSPTTRFERSLGRALIIIILARIFSKLIRKSDNTYNVLVIKFCKSIMFVYGNVDISLGVLHLTWRFAQSNKIKIYVSETKSFPFSE